MENLSPLSQYYLRKLLNQEAESHSTEFLPQSFVSSKTVEFIQNKQLPTSSLRELEILIHHYQNIETQLTYHNENLVEMKRRIFRILGLRLNSLAPSTIPTVVQESASSIFRFLQQGRLQEGTHFGEDVYGLIQQYNLVQRQQAYQVAWALTDQKVPFILTASELRYGVWVCLRSPTYRVLITQGLSVLNRIVSLASIMNGFREAMDLPV